MDSENERFWRRSSIDIETMYNNLKRMKETIEKRIRCRCHLYNTIQSVVHSQEEEELYVSVSVSPIDEDASVYHDSFQHSDPWRWNHLDSFVSSLFPVSSGSGERLILTSLSFFFSINSFIILSYYQKQDLNHTTCLYFSSFPYTNTSTPFVWMVRHLSIPFHTWNTMLRSYTSNK